MDTPVSAKAAILRALFEGPGFGDELSRRLHERTAGGVRLRPGSLYPALATLEAEGLVRSWTIPRPERGRGRPRRYYELAPAGIEAASRVQEVLASLVRREVLPPLSPRELERMGARLLACLELGAFTMDMRQRVEAHRGG